MVVPDHLAGLDVDPMGRSQFEPVGGVGVAVPSGADPGIVVRELVVAVGEHRLGHGCRCRIDHPPGEPRRTVPDRSVLVAVKHPVVTAEVDHDGAVVVVGVDRMEHIALGGLAPHDVVGGPVTWEEPDPCWMVGIPGKRERGSAHGGLDVEAHRQVVDEGVPGRERHVVDHRHTADRYFGHLRHPTVAADDHVLHPIELVRIGVADGVQFAGCRVVFGVGGEAAGQGAVEAVVPDGVEVVGEGHGRGAGLDHRPGLPGEAAHCRVGTEVAVAERTARWRVLAQFGRHAGTPHPPVAVPLGSTTPQPHSVDHAVAEKPMVGRRVDDSTRVGSVPQPAPF